MKRTTNMGLPIIGVEQSDLNMTFLQYRQEIAGDNDSSAMNIIDNFAKDANDRLGKLEQNKLDRNVFHEIQMEGKPGYINYKNGNITSSSKSQYYELDCDGIVQIEYYPGEYLDTGGYAFYNDDGFIAGSSKKTTDNSEKVSLTIPEGATIFRGSFQIDQINVGLWVKRAWFEEALDRIDLLESNINDLAYLKNDMQIALGAAQDMPVGWAQGGLQPSVAGAAVSASNRIRTDFIEQRGSRRILVKSNGQRIYWLQYTSAETAGYTHVNGGWLTEDALLPAGDYWYRIMVSNLDDISTITPDDVLVQIQMLSGLRVEADTLRADVEGLNADTEAIRSAARQQEHRLANLEAAANGNLYRVETDSESVRAKVVPVNVMPWAMLDIFGGNVASVLVRGVNMYDKDDAGTAEGIVKTTSSSNLNLTAGTTSSAVGTTPVRLLHGVKYAITAIVKTLDGGALPGLNRVVYWMNDERATLPGVTGTIDEEQGIAVYHAAFTPDVDCDFGLYAGGVRTKSRYHVRLMIARSDTELDFVPYRLESHEVPETIRGLPGYGEDGALVDLERGVFVDADGVETVIEVPDTLRDLAVESGGEITFVQADGVAVDVPNEISYLIKLNTYDIGSRVSMSDDGNGNVSLTIG